MHGTMHSTLTLCAHPLHITIIYLQSQYMAYAYHHQPTL